MSWYRLAGVAVAWALTCATAVARPPPRGAPGAAPRAPFDQVAADAAKAREAAQVDAAIALYRRALSMRPSWDEGQWYLGSLLYELGRAREARAAFDQLARLQPRHAAAVAMSGLCEFQLGDREAALRLLLRARQLNVQQSPEIATVARYHTAILLTRFGEFEAGNQVLTELAADGQESPLVVEAFGLNVLRTPMLPGEAVAATRDRILLAGQAGFAMGARRAATARPLLEQLVSRYPDSSHVHYLWGVFLLADDPARALDAFRRALEVTPSHVPARLQMVFELVKQGEATAARPLAEKAIEIDPQAFGPRLALGQVLLGLGDTASAITAFEEAVRLAPESPQTPHMPAVAYGRAGRTADADRARAEFTRLSK